MKITVFETETERIEYLANLLEQSDIEMTFNQILETQFELSKVGFYNE